MISDGLKEAFKMITIPLSKYAEMLAKEEGKEEGRREGERKGKEEGRREGKEEGRRENKFEVARTMLADGLPAETIRKYTGLDESSILSLR
jgi:predicted transposase/invertase (TIGR01784 family)